jgi:asparagine synthase (glutamine-hydrolysing)
MKGCHDLKFVSEHEGIFESEIKAIELTYDKLEKYLKKVIEILEHIDLMQVGISIPIYVACENARKDGIKTVLSGQGADELFAGYYRYLNMPPQKLEKESKKDLKELFYFVEKRDRAIAKANSVNMKFPYLSKAVIKVANSIPISMKIKGKERKYILKEVAKRRGIPETIVYKGKKSMQYSSGVDKALRLLAKRDDKIKEYLKWK